MSFPRDGPSVPRRDLPSFERDVRRMFGALAGRYQRFNHVSSLGNDLVWRPLALWELARFRPDPPHRALDVGCGTGDFCRAIARRFPSADVVGVDFTRAMIEEARGRAVGRAARPRLAYATGNVQRLPFADRSFDLVTNAFVLRNVTDLDAGFREMRRVLRPGGVLLSLEITEPPNAFVGRAFHAYFDHVVPLVGRAIADEGASRYLPESLKRFPPREAIVDRLRSANFDRIVARPFSSGIVTVFLAATPPSPDQSR